MSVLNECSHFCFSAHCTGSGGTSVTQEVQFVNPNWENILKNIYIYSLNKFKDWSLLIRLWSCTESMPLLTSSSVIYNKNNIIIIHGIYIELFRGPNTLYSVTLKTKQ